MEDIDSSYVDNSTTFSKISYALLDGKKHRPNVCRWFKSVSPILVSVLLLTVLIPLYVLVQDSSGKLYTTSTEDIPQHWIERAIYYNSHKVVQQPKTFHNLTSSYKLVCYYTFSRINATDALHPSDIDPNLCTHINVGFASIINNTIFVDENESQIIHGVVALKRQNPKLKVLLSIGGGGSNGGFPSMVVNHTCRKSFIKSIDVIVRTYGIDGIDLDWEFPNKVPSHDSKQKMHFTQLLYEIRKEIKRQQKHKFLLTVAVAAARFIVDLAYDISYMNSYVDFVNVMTYDYHFYTEFTPFTGLNSPLYADINQTGYLATMNINYTINYWREKGMDADKIIMGLPTYAHSFELVNENNNGIMAPARGYGSLGRSGFVNYADICAFLARDNVKYVFDYYTRSPYASREWDWVSFDDATSLTFKTEYIEYNKLGGAMILSLNADDHKGRCSKNAMKFPLTSRVKEILHEV